MVRYVCSTSRRRLEAASDSRNVALQYATKALPADRCVLFGHVYTI